MFSARRSPFNTLPHFATHWDLVREGVYYLPPVPATHLSADLFGAFLLSIHCYSALMKAIVQDGDPVLRQKAQAVDAAEFGTPELTALIREMETVLDAEPDGVALAAPQIAVSKRIFIVRYDRMKERQNGPEVPERGTFINPEFVKASRRMIEMDEGCLSVRGIYGKTHRHDRATMRAYDEHGVRFERGGGGVLAQAFQHETDHLDGMLFVDHAHLTYEHVRTDTDA